jgi:hypothetical protein
MGYLNDAADPEPNEAEKPEPGGGGEDESSTEQNGDDSHLHEDQKSPKFGEP